MKRIQPRTASGRCQASPANGGKCLRVTNLIAAGEWRCDIHLRGKVFQALVKLETVDA